MNVVEMDADFGCGFIFRSQLRKKATKTRTSPKSDAKVMSFQSKSKFYVKNIRIFSLK